MSTDFASLILKADSSDFVKADKVLKNFTSQSEKTEMSVLGLIKTFKGLAVAAGGIYTVRKIAGGFNELVQAGSDLNETMSKTSIVLGSAFSDVEKWAIGAADAIGQSKKEALDAASTFGIFAKSAGLSGKNLGDFSMKFTTLASDFASFYNTSPADAILAIGAAFRGEYEPIRRYGVLIDEMSLKQAALASGIITSTKGALTPQQKVLAASELIMKRSIDAQGDFARTSDQAANKQRILAANIQDAKERIGTQLLPVMNEFLNIGLKIVNSPLPKFFENLAAGIAGTNAVENINKMNEAFEYNIALSEELKKAREKDPMLDTAAYSKAFADRWKLYNSESTNSMQMLQQTKQVSEQRAKAEIEAERAIQNAKAEAAKAAKAEADTKAKEEAEKRLNGLREDGIRLTEEMHTPLEALAEKEKELDDLLKSKSIDESVYNKAKKKYNDDFNKSVQDEIDSLTSGLISEEEQINRSYERRNQAILGSELLTKEQKDALIEQSKLAHEEEIKEYIDKEKEKAEKVAEIAKQKRLDEIQGNIDLVMSYENLFGGIADAMAIFGKKHTALYKAMFITSKMFALAEIALNIQRGLVASGAIGFPQNLLTIGPYIAQTAGILAEVGAISFKDKGGYVKSNEYAVTEEIGPEIIRGPAQVTSRNKTAQMFDELQSKGSGNTYSFTFHLHDSNFIGNNAAARDFSKVVWKNIESEMTRVGAVA